MASDNQDNGWNQDAGNDDRLQPDRYKQEEDENDSPSRDRTIEKGDQSNSDNDSEKSSKSSLGEFLSLTLKPDDPQSDDEKQTLDYDDTNEIVDIGGLNASSSSKLREYERENQRIQLFEQYESNTQNKEEERIKEYEIQDQYEDNKQKEENDEDQNIEDNEAVDELLLLDLEESPLMAAPSFEKDQELTDSSSIINIIKQRMKDNEKDIEQENQKRNIIETTSTNLIIEEPRIIQNDY
ncbi:MAG: hypothetical protein EZS28_040594 [Streblomastix strix]|uniref:Uncharacterized protein n=1 Tax=Streblomastix strix TaxID=222440 RepID=A0A5J4U0U5_9EUKA|nr:MAG: hypothetical protein EZS28_040594 [Streblomastix strix]